LDTLIYLIQEYVTEQSWLNSLRKASEQDKTFYHNSSNAFSWLNSRTSSSVIQKIIILSQLLLQHTLLKQIKHNYIDKNNVPQSTSLVLPILVLRPNPEGFYCVNWKEREGGSMEGRIQ